MGIKTNIARHIIAICFSLTCWLVCFAPQLKAQEITMTRRMGHYPTGILDTVKAEIVIETGQTFSLEHTRKILMIVDGYIEREKYSYCGDPMPNGLPNNGGAYDDYYVTKRFLDENKNEIKEFIWLSREILNKTSN